MARVLVTGATGFIGAHLVRALIDRGDSVTCVARRTSRLDALPTSEIEIAQGDVANADSIRQAVAGKEVVYHLAGLIKGLSYAELLRVNEGGVRNVAAACASLESPPTLVVVSSLAAAGPSTLERPRVEADPPAPVSYYGRSKLAGEQAAADFADKIPVSVVRPPIVFGAGDRGMFPLFRMLRRRNTHLVPGFKVNRFSLIHAEDLAAGIIATAERGERMSPKNSSDQSSGAGCYFLAASETPTYAELGRMIGQAVGRADPYVFRLPQLFGWVVGAAGSAFAQVTRTPRIVSLDKMREAAGGSWTCSADKALRDLGSFIAAPLQQRLNQTGLAYRDAGWLRF